MPNNLTADGKCWSKWPVCMKAFILKLILPTKYWHMPRGSVKTKLAQLVKVIVDIRTDRYSHASVFTHLL